MIYCARKWEKENVEEICYLTNAFNLVTKTGVIIWINGAVNKRPGDDHAYMLKTPLYPAQRQFLNYHM